MQYHALSQKISRKEGNVMRFVDLIEKKKQKQPLTKEELHFFITGYVQGGYSGLSGQCAADGDLL